MTSFYVLTILLISVIIYFSSRANLITFLCTIGLVVLIPVTYLETLSKPKGTMYEIAFRNLEEAEVLSYVVDYGYGLYMLLKIEGVKEPRYYFEPWNDNTREMAQKLQDMAEQKQKPMIRFPFEPSLETEKKIHPLPQPKRGEKKEPETGPRFSL